MRGDDFFDTVSNPTMLTPEVFSVAHDSSSRDRDEDILIEKFFIERNIILTPEVMRRILLLNKRRKEFHKEGDVVYGGEASSTHLKDILDIIDILPKEIQIAASFHDIGKTGPWREDVGSEDTLDQIIIALFAAIHNLDIKKTTVADLLKIIAEGDRLDFDKALQTLKDNGIDPQMMLNNFYPLHVQWGKTILEHEPNIQLKDKWIALNHHRLLRGIEIDVEGYVPTEGDFDKAAYLEIVDFFVARYNRSSEEIKTIKEEVRKVFASKITTEKLEEILAILPD